MRSKAWKDDPFSGEVPRPPRSWATFAAALATGIVGLIAIAFVIIGLLVYLALHSI